MRRHIALTIGTLLIAGCPAGYANLCDNGACDTDASIGDSGIDAPPGCDLTKDPKDSLPCVDDSIGIFVDATGGKDSNAGTKEAPMQTIGAALGKTNTQHARVYVCEGTYTEDVTLDASHDGVSLYGGWKCADWSYSGNKPVIGKTNNAFKIDSLATGTTIEDLSVVAADATNAGDSSIAMFVNASKTVSLARVALSAGVGIKGADGTLTNYTFPGSLDGNNADGGAGGAAKSVTCPNGDISVGGKGGDNGFDGQDGTPGPSDKGTLAACSGTNTGGGKGAAGIAGLDAVAIISVGVLEATGWAPTSADGGAGGAVGQGGGGGGGVGGGGGGSGGAGGCGGAGGGGGSGGGSSFGLVAVASTVNVTASTITTKSAGNGGAGVAGQLGQTPGGLAGAATIPGCNGGSGGAGGNGGAGGGGAGGLSVGVFYKGTAPTLDSATTGAITVGSKGTGGAGGAANDGVDGVAQPTLECQTPLCN